MYDLWYEFKKINNFNIYSGWLVLKNRWINFDISIEIYKEHLVFIDIKIEYFNKNMKSLNIFNVNIKIDKFNIN